MSRLTSRQSRWALAYGVLLYVAVIAGVVAWLVHYGAATTRIRLAHTPQTVINFAVPEEKPVEVPTSWTEKPSTERVAEKPVVEAVAPPAALPEPVVQAKWRQYARAFDQNDKRPRVILIIDNLGLSADIVKAAMDLPGDITLAFSTLTPDLETVIAQARKAGHETLLTIPMEPQNYPQNDSGPNTLLTELPDAENTSRLERHLAQADGYLGIMPFMGEKFVASEEKITPVIQVIKDQGLLIVDDTTAQKTAIAPVSRLLKIPAIRASLRLDAAMDGLTLDQQLSVLEHTAQENGNVIAVVEPYPATFEALKIWFSTLQKNDVVLAPLSSAAQ